MPPCIDGRLTFPNRQRICKVSHCKSKAVEESTVALNIGSTPESTVDLRVVIANVLSICTRRHAAI